MKAGTTRAKKRTGAVPGGLQRQALGMAAGHLMVLLLFFYGLNHAAPANDARAGGAVAALVLALVHGILWRHLAENRPHGAIQAAAHLGTANQITLGRGLLISLTAGFLFASPGTGQAPAAAWLPGSLYTAAALLDGLDGAWARKTRTRTRLGEVLDVRYDALGVLVASAVAVGTGRLPVYYLSAGGAYYVFQLALRLRQGRGKPVYPPRPRTFARLVAGFQMGFLSGALLPLFPPPVLALAAPVFLLPLLAGFVWDWLIATGRIGDAAAHRGEGLLAALVAKGPLVLRGFILMAGVVVFFAVPAEPLSASMVLWAGLVLMVTAGFLGRTAALSLSLLLAHQASGAAEVSPWLTAMLPASLLIMLTGTGVLSLWRPEDALLLGKPEGSERPRHTPHGRAVEGGRFPRRSVRPVSGRRTAGQAAALAAVAGLLYWAWRDVPLGAVAAAVGRWGWPQWGLLAVLNLFILAAMCWRWSFILRQMGHPVGFAALIGYRVGANTLSYITPGPQFGGEPFQAHCLAARHRVPAEAAAASVVVDRLVELLGNLIFLSLAGLLVLPALLAETHALLPVLALSAVALFIGILLYIVAAGGRPFSRLAGRAASWIGRPQGLAGFVTFLQAGESQAAGILTDRLWGWYALGGLFQWAGFLAELWLIYAFMGMSLGPAGLLTVAVAARLAFLLPLPGGLGALEAGQMLAVTSLGGDPAVAAAACGIMRARDLVLVSSGGVLAVRWMGPAREGPGQPPLKPA